MALHCLSNISVDVVNVVENMLNGCYKWGKDIDKYTIAININKLYGNPLESPMAGDSFECFCPFSFEAAANGEDRGDLWIFPI